MTDPRIGDLEATILHLPKGAGIIFRHHELPPTERLALFRRVQTLARRRRHLLLLAGPPDLARQWGADGAHERSARQSRGLRTAPAHSVCEAAGAVRAGADLIFVSPVFATRSHVAESALGRVGLGMIAGRLKGRTIALGGMNVARARSLRALKLYGWAGIDALSKSRVRT